MSKEDLIQKLIIVKHAADGHWEEYFLADPKPGAHIYFSAYFNRVGKECGIQYYYESMKKAKEDLQKLFNCYPGDGFAICNLLELD